MKIKNIYLLIIVLSLSYVNGNAQSSGFYRNNLTSESNRLEGKLRGENYFISMVANNYYFLHKKWFDATITLADNDVYENVKARYMSYEDELISFNDNLNSVFYKIDKDIIKEFVLKETTPTGGIVDRKFVKLYFDGLRKGDRFFEKVYSGTADLLVMHTVITEGVQPYKDEAGIMRNTEYRPKQTYYMYTPENGFAKLVTKKRAFLKTFPEHKKEIRRIFRQNSISLRNYGAMVQAFGLLDQAGIMD